MTRQAGPGDEDALDRFLAPHTATSMFLRSNLARFGLGPNAHPNATAYWRLPPEGPLRAVLGLTNAGVVLCQAPAAAPDDIAALAGALAGRSITGLTGEAAQIEALVAALGLTAADLRANACEPLYRLALADLPPARPGEGLLRPPGPAEAAVLADWFLAYFRDIGYAAPDPGAEAAHVRQRVAAVLDGSAHCRLLLRDGRPVAMAGLNARVAQAVQVGGVYVPPAARGRGLGRAVTRALLAEAQDEGATEAILFANNPAAARAYEAIGFIRIGSYRIVFLTGLRRIGAP